MTVLRWIWESKHYWPLWLGCLVMGPFLAREITALATGDPKSTLSDWWWKLAKIYQGETPAQWTATTYLVFGVWCVLFSWLTWHFFFRKFT